jgi:hypothetical protein
MSQKQNSKLEMFLEMALMDQQFGLAIFENRKQEKNLQQTFTNKKIKHTRAGDPNILFQQKEDLILFELGEDNLQRILDIVHQIRLQGVYQNQGQKIQLPDRLKMIFLIKKSLLEAQTEELQDKILYTFSPVFRFET